MYTWPVVDFDALRRWRSERVAELMRQQRVDHLLLTGFDNIRYATDYRTQIIAEAYDWFAALVDADGSARIFVPWVDEDTLILDAALPSVVAVHPLPSWTPAVPHAGYWADVISAHLGDAKRVGYELIYPEIVDGLSSRLSGTEFVALGTALFDLRQIKHPAELTLLEAASVVNASAAQAGLAAAAPGMTDLDILAVIMADLQQQGVEFLSHSLCNHRRGSGTWFAAGTVLDEGDPYFFDIGCYGLGGYASDIARTGFVGEPDRAVRAGYQVLLEAYHAAQEVARPGVKASDVHEAVNRYLAAKGYPRTPYSMGHGVGLRACELPTIHRADRLGRDQPLVEGSVISLEPETAVVVNDELMLLKIEDNFVVEADGLRLLSAPSDGAPSGTGV